MGKTIVAANAMPIRLKDGVVSAADGGLVSAMAGLLRDGSTTWVGLVRDDELYGRMDSNHRLHYCGGDYDFDIHGIRVPEEGRRRHYGGFSNGFLWEKLHSTERTDRSTSYPCTTAVNGKDWAAYDFVDNTFGSGIFVELLLEDRQNPGGKKRVFVHDYHLLLVPRNVRSYTDKAGMRTGIAYFHHIPFPAPDRLSAFAGEFKELIRGVLGSDIACFHIPRYADNFADCAREFLEGAYVEDAGKGEHAIYYNGRRTQVQPIPIGVETGKILKAVKHRKIQNTYGGIDLNDVIGRRKGAGVDVWCLISRADYTKGIPEAMRILDGVLELRPKKPVQLIVFASPSRTEVEAYRRLSMTTRKEQERVNKKWREAYGFEPVLLFEEKIEFPDNVTLPGKSDMVLAPSISEGFGLTSLEGILAQKWRKKSERACVVLGETSGAAYELRDFTYRDGKIVIDPLNREESVWLLNEARVREWGVSDKLIENVEMRDIETFQKMLENELDRYSA